MAKQLTVSINDDARDFVKAAATVDAVSEPDIVRKALATYKYLRRIQKADGEIIIRRAGGTFERLMNL